MDSLNAYARALDKSLDKGKKFAQFNKDMHHATIVVCTAMSHAKEDVWLLSHKLDPMLYGGPWFQEAASGFLQRGGRLHILVESDVADDHPVMKLARDHGDQVTIKRVPEDELRYQYNFMVVDDIGFRFERDRRKYGALVVFHDSDEDHASFVSTLKERYDELSALADNIWPG